ncbi:MAG: DUF2508 family protein [Bacillota bacterium]
MSFMVKLRDRVLSRISPHYPRHPDLVDEVHESLREWQQAKVLFNFAGRDFIDYTVYRLNAAERRYAALLALARSEGVKAWPDNLVEPVKNPELGIKKFHIGDGSQCE